MQKYGQYTVKVSLRKRPFKPTLQAFVAQLGKCALRIILFFSCDGHFGIRDHPLPHPSWREQNLVHKL